MFGRAMLRWETLRGRRERLEFRMFFMFGFAVTLFFVFSCFCLVIYYLFAVGPALRVEFCREFGPQCSSVSRTFLRFLADDVFWCKFVVFVCFRVARSAEVLGFAMFP